MRRDRVVAVDARDLLDQVFLDREVEAAASAASRCQPSAVGLDGQAERAQDAFDFGVGDGHAEHARQARAAQRDRLRLRQVFGQRGFDHRAGRAAGDLEDQARRVLDRVRGSSRIDAALEAVRRRRCAGRACGRGR